MLGVNCQTAPQRKTAHWSTARHPPGISSPPLFAPVRVITCLSLVRCMRSQPLFQFAEPKAVPRIAFVLVRMAHLAPAIQVVLRQTVRLELVARRPVPPWTIRAPPATNNNQPPPDVPLLLPAPELLTPHTKPIYRTHPAACQAGRAPEARLPCVHSSSGVCSFQRRVGEYVAPSAYPVRGKNAVAVASRKPGKRGRGESRRALGRHLFGSVGSKG